MVRLLLSQDRNYELDSIPVAIGLFISVSVLVALCAKHGRSGRVSQKENQTNRQTNGSSTQYAAPKSPLAKAIPFAAKKPYAGGEGDDSRAETGGDVEDGGFGEGGLWQKSIMMGEKCQPPEFPGVIYYDRSGNQVPEMPRSPRASHFPSFSFPVELKHTN